MEHAFRGYCVVCKKNVSFRRISDGEFLSNLGTAIFSGLLSPVGTLFSTNRRSLSDAPAAKDYGICPHCNNKYLVCPNCGKAICVGKKLINYDIEVCSFCGQKMKHR